MKLFLSCPGERYTFVRKIADRLLKESQGLDVYLYNSLPPPGNVDDAVRRHARQSDVFLLFLFPNARVDSLEYQQEELRAWQDSRSNHREWRNSFYLFYIEKIDLSEDFRNLGIFESTAHYPYTIPAHDDFKHGAEDEWVRSIVSAILVTFHIPKKKLSDLLREKFSISEHVAHEQQVIRTYLEADRASNIDIANAILKENGFSLIWPQVLRYDEGERDQEVKQWHEDEDDEKNGKREEDEQEQNQKQLFKRFVNPLDSEKYGEHRHDDACVGVSVRFRMSDSSSLPRFTTEAVASHDSAGIRGVVGSMSFPEAGPRREIVLREDSRFLRIGIVVSGGIAPGTNAVIEAILRRHKAYSAEGRKTEANRTVEVYLCRGGFKRVVQFGRNAFSEHTLDQALKQAQSWSRLGGSWLPTSRAPDLATRNIKTRHKLFSDIVATLKSFGPHKDDGLDILYVIGGDGSMRAAHAIQSAYMLDRREKARLRVIGIPKTMDNDILWVWQSFGFLSAVEEAKRAVVQMATEVISNPRVAIVQLYGSMSGFVGSHAAFASQYCDLVLIPELFRSKKKGRKHDDSETPYCFGFSMTDVCNYVSKILLDRGPSAESGEGMSASPWALVVMAETAIPSDFRDYLECVDLNGREREALKEFEERGFRVVGETPDGLRSAGLKIVSGILQEFIQKRLGNISLAKDGSDRYLPPLHLQRPGFADREYWNDFRVVVNEPRHLIRTIEPTTMDIVYGARLGTMGVDMAMAGYRDCIVSQWLTEYVAVPLELVTLGRKRVSLSGVFWKNVVAKTGQADFVRMGTKDVRPFVEPPKPREEVSAADGQDREESASAAGISLERDLGGGSGLGGRQPGEEGGLRGAGGDEPEAERG